MCPTPPTTRESTQTHLHHGVRYLPAHNLQSMDTLSKAATSVHDRLSGEDPYQIMYIMAAVDCDIDE